MGRILTGSSGASADSGRAKMIAAVALGETLEFSNMALSAGETVVVCSDKATVSVRVHGYEEA